MDHSRIVTGIVIPPVIIALTLDGSARWEIYIIEFLISLCLTWGMMYILYSMIDHKLFKLLSIWVSLRFRRPSPVTCCLKLLSVDYLWSVKASKKDPNAACTYPFETVVSIRKEIGTWSDSQIRKAILWADMADLFPRKKNIKAKMPARVLMLRHFIDADE